MAKRNSRKRDVATAGQEFYFNYRVFIFGELVSEEVVKVFLPEDAIKNVALILQENGGKEVDVFQLDYVLDCVRGAIFPDEYNRFVNEDNYDDIDIEIENAVPQSVIKAAQKYISYMDVDQEFYLEVDGIKKRESLKMRVSKSAFDAMVKVAGLDRCGRTDFEMLKEQAPKAYEEIVEKTVKYGQEISVYEIMVNLSLAR